MNLVCITGRLTDNPKYHDNGENPVAKFSVAVDREFKKEGGQNADFPRVVVFGKTATNCNKYLNKGDMVAVRGRIQTGSYQDNDGKTVYTTDVIADRVEFLQTKGKREGPQEQEDNFLQLNEDVPF